MGERRFVFASPAVYNRVRLTLTVCKIGRLSDRKVAV